MSNANETNAVKIDRARFAAHARREVRIILAGIAAERAAGNPFFADMTPAQAWELAHRGLAADQKNFALQN